MGEAALKEERTRRAWLGRGNPDRAFPRASSHAEMWTPYSKAPNSARETKTINHTMTSWLLTSNMKHYLQLKQMMCVH